MSTMDVIITWLGLNGCLSYSVSIFLFKTEFVLLIIVFVVCNLIFYTNCQF